MFRKLVMQKPYLDTHLPLASPVFDDTLDKAALHYLSLDRERLANNYRAVNFDALPQPLLVGGQALGKSMISVPHRSEERRVGKECRSRWSPYH